MGLFDFLWRLFARRPAPPPRPEVKREAARRARPTVKPKLVPLRREQLRQRRRPVPPGGELVPEVPYRFARMGVMGGFLDLSLDGDPARLARFGLPVFSTPEELATWLGMPVGRLAWLTHRCDLGRRPVDVRSSHYHYYWLPKRGGGYRLIEAPKPLLRKAQQQILEQILNRIPPHPAVHGFVIGRSIRTNALPHVGRHVVVRFDLENFYPNVGFSRVVAIFRSLGYSREAAIWLGSLTTSALPASMPYPPGELTLPRTFQRRHLPQGASTSPALANLSAFALDLRLAGLARTFAAHYTRYADDLTFSGSLRLLHSLSVFLPLVRRIVRDERFRVHPGKRRVMRRSQQQRVTGVVVNAHPNAPRKEFDRLKAILNNCVRRGPSTQNHERHEDFPGHLRGRIAHVTNLNQGRGQKLLALYAQIDWQS